VTEGEANMKDGSTVRRFNRLKFKENRDGYLFILPSIIGLSIFVIYPLIASVYYSLTRWTGFSAPQFIGLKNFIYMFTTDPSFWPSIRATGLYVFISVPLGLVLGLLLAVLLNKHLPGIKIFRTLYYLPVILPAVASTALFEFIFNPQYGLANQILHVFHISGLKWLQSPKTALISMVIIALWSVGSTMIIFLAGLQGVPVELYEAAQVDGASTLHSFFRITLPMITPILFLQLITGMIGAFQEFVKPAILTQGGPNFATNLLNYSIWTNAINFQHFGYASAEVWVLFVVTMLFTALIFKYTNNFVYYEND
jgi:ABC-type sugar transport system permease subunit